MSGTDIQNYPNKPLETGFISGESVTVSVSDGPPNGNDIWYNLEVKHGEFQWTFQKKLSNVSDLVLRLKVHETFNGLPSRGDASSEEEAALDVMKLFYLTSSRERESAAQIRTDMEKCLNYILSVDEFRNHSATLKFFNLSGFSFKKELGSRGKEGFLQLKSLWNWFSIWNKRWCVLKDTFLMFLDANKEAILGVFLFDASSSVEIEDKKYLNLMNSTDTIRLYCADAKEAQNWMESIKKNMENVDAEFGSAPNKSFSPARPSIAHWFVDGADFFSAVAEALESATEEIFITGWMVMPHIYLKRKKALEDRWMLQSIIKKKADEGIKIYLLVYDGPDVALELGENYVKETLERLSGNIKVLRHRGERIGDILWSHHEKLVIIDQSIAFVSGLDQTIGRWDYHRHPLTDLPDSPETTDPGGPHMSHPTWRGIDYSNDYVKAATAFDEPFLDHLNRYTTPRMPWHDVGSVTYHESARDVARHFIQRWNFAKAKEHREDDEFAFLLPKINSTPEEKSATKIHPEAVAANVQVLRSCAAWSAGLTETESSIHEAYIHAIDNSEGFIYIENQFFISAKDDEEIQNLIVTALCERIYLAKGTKFRVYIVIPLVPAFEGDFRKDEASQQMQIISHFQYISMARGNKSLVGALLQKGMTMEEIREHVYFCALRSNGQLNGEVITEVLYVHSKMMVVDDKVSIIGSANINDRSMLGDRDSEVALCITDTEMIESVMDGKKHMVGKFSSNLRKRLFAEHLGMLPEDYDDELSQFEGHEQLNDIVSDDFYHGVWKKIARTNTKLYDMAFKSIPVNSVKKFSEVEEYQSRAVQDQEARKKIMKKVIGNLVKYPTQYLADEDLQPDALSYLNLVPPQTFT